MRISILVVCLTGTLAANVQAAERHASIPARFQGEWNMRADHCGTSLNDSRLRISAREIRHFESRGKVLAVVTRGRNELAVITESSGEGETWLATQQYRLSANQRELIDTRSEPALVRHRCPASRRAVR